MSTSAMHRAVIDFFRLNARELPWRTRATGAWGVLLSEVMSQQTPVERVAPRWLEWIQRWPDPAALAHASSAEVLAAWGSLGYPRRALRLLECARTLTTKFEGVLPRDVATLRTLPGVGEYTAAAVAAFGYDERVVVLDTNIRRVLTRVLDGTNAPRPSLGHAERKRAADLLPSDARESVLWNEGLMELGALVCIARAPRCAECPLVSMCAFYAAGLPGLGERTVRPQAFEGTDRQLRGRVLKALRQAPGTALSLERVRAAAATEEDRFEKILNGLEKDGLIHRTESRVGLGGI